MECERCGRTGPEGSNFCPDCGNRYPQSVKCPRCGNQSTPESRFCFKCGASLRELSASSEIPAAGPVGDQAERPRWEPPGCPRCSARIQPGSPFCFRCGFPFDRDPSTLVRHAPGLPGFVTADPAGFWIRSIAFLVDSGVVLLVTFLVFRDAFLETGELAVSVSGSGYDDLVGAIYYTVLIAIWATTAGKRIFGLRVVRTDGSKVGIGRAFVRYIAYYLSAIVLLIGFIMIAFREDKRGLHDLICDTVVIKRSS